MSGYSYSLERRQRVYTGGIKYLYENLLCRIDFIVHLRGFEMINYGSYRFRAHKFHDTLVHDDV